MEIGRGVHESLRIDFELAIRRKAPANTDANDFLFRVRLSNELCQILIPVCNRNLL